MSIDSKLYKEIIEFLIGFSNLQNEEGRRALLLNAGLKDIIPILKFKLGTKDYVSILINELDKYGTLSDGQNALISLLEEMKSDIGMEGQTKLHSFIERLTDKRQLDVSCPYRGLYHFREEDTKYFFGREIFTTKLLEDVENKSLIALIGASGSGKSSVVYAGLFPILRQRKNWLLESFRFRKSPLHNLSSTLIPLLETDMSEINRLKEINKEFPVSTVLIALESESKPNLNKGVLFKLNFDIK